MQQESVELGYKLIELPEGEETTILGQRGSTCVQTVPKKDDSRVHGLLTRIELGEALDTWLRDTILEAETKEPRKVSGSVVR
jgi:hypothetical protein